VKKAFYRFLSKGCDDPMYRVKVFEKCGYPIAEISCSPDLQIKENSIF
jgi:hypothetical protein